MKKGCVKCFDSRAGGGSMESLRKKGVEPDFTLLHKVLKYSILKCNQCGTYQLYNDKCFEDLTEQQIPAVIDWEHSFKVYTALKEVLSPIMKKPFFGPVYGGLCDVTTNHKESYENAMCFVSPHPLTSESYEPLYPSSNINDIIYKEPINNHETYMRFHLNKPAIFCIRCPWEDTHWYHKQKEWHANQNSNNKSVN